MKCPRCGADNAEQAPWCSLCQYAFQENPGGAIPPELPGEAQQYQPPPGAYQEQGGQAYPPNVSPGQYGYPPPPGAFPPGYAPPAPSHGLSASTRVLAGMVIMLVFLGLLAGAIYLITNKTATITVPVPPGYQEVSVKEKDAMEKSMQTKASEVVVDNYLTNESGDGVIVVFHQKMSLAEAPPEDPKKMEEFYNMNKDEVMHAFAGGFEQAAGYGVDAKISLYQVEKLTCGDSALHLSIDVSMGRNAMVMNMSSSRRGARAFVS